MDQNGSKWNICYNIRVLNDDGLLNLHGLIYLDFMEMDYIICVFVLYPEKDTSGDNIKVK